MEDSEFNRDLLVQLFETAYELELAGDGETAVELAVARCPDAILMDIGLPGMSGLEAARAIRERVGQVPIVAVSSSVMPGDQERALAAGLDAFVPKPIDDVRLLELVSRLTEQ